MDTVEEARKLRKDVERVQGLPDILVGNIKASSKEDLAEMFIDLRCWCGQVYLELKDLRTALAERNNNARTDTGTTELPA